MKSIITLASFGAAIFVMLASCAGPERTVTTGAVTFATGENLIYQYPYQYDRNALVALEPVEDGWVALTQFGSLLRFDRQFSLRQEVLDHRYCCLASGRANSLIAGERDGTVDSVDPHTLAPTVLGRAPRDPIAVIADQAGGKVFAVVRQDDWTDGNAVVWDVTARQGYEIADRPTTFFIDHSHRLWIGADHGEFGGWCRCLDLLTGKVHDVEMDNLGIYGFTELPGGQVIAYGGYSHMGAASAGIWNASENGLAAVFKNDGADHPRNPPAIPEQPISQIVPTNDGLAVFSYSDVYLTDRAFKNWRRLATLNVRYTPGRPDAMGDYPAVTEVRRAGGDALVCATASDGLIELASGHVISHTLSKQIDLRDFRFFGRDERGIVAGNRNAWGMYDLIVLRDGSTVPLDLQLPPAPAGEEWRRTFPIRIDQAEQVLAADEGHSPGDVALVRWRGGRRELVSRDVGSLWLDSIFETPDGTFWEAGYDTLKKLVDGKWKEQAKLPEGGDHAFKVINRQAPWRLVGNGSLWILHDNDGKASLEKFDAKGREGETLVCRDGMEVEGRFNGATLVVTAQGMYVWEKEGEKESEITINHGDLDTVEHVTTDKEIEALSTSVRNAQCMCVDAQGACWVGGAGIWCRPKNGKQFVGWNPFPGGVAVTSMVDCAGGGVLAVTSEGAMLKAQLTDAHSK